MEEKQAKMARNTQRELLELGVALTEHNACNDPNCLNCIYSRLNSQVAKKILERTDIPEDQLINEWRNLLEFELKKLPSYN